LKKYLHILLALLSFTLTSTLAKAQNPYDLPMACIGSEQSYWVKGFNGISDFEWRIIDPNGNNVPTEFYELINRGDTLVIYWGFDLPGGIYTFEVIEHSDYGCTGDPYTQYIMLNSPTINIPFDGVPQTVGVCYGDMGALDPGAFQSYLWQDATTNRIFYTGDAGTYQVQLVQKVLLTDGLYHNECTYNEMELELKALPVVWLGNDTVLFGAQTLVLDAYHPETDLYSWYEYNFQSQQWSNTPFSISSSVTVEGGTGDQWIYVEARKDYFESYMSQALSCYNTDSIYIRAENYNNLRIPAAFTPNGDGVNDTWIFPAPKAPDYIDNGLWSYLNDVEVRVFNRWGKMVWKSDGPVQPWNGKDLGGKELPMDSYHYIIRIKVDGKVFERKGSVTIVR
jgi:gliding motility-associated-like protein